MTATRKEKDITTPTHSGKLGDHPVGGAVGAAIGAAAGAAAVGVTTGVAQGAALGSVAGPIGAAAGMVVGGVAGALAGKGLAQVINPTTEDAYWANNYSTRPYVEANSTYDYYQPAYRYGIDSFSKYEGRPYNEVESQLSSNWNSARGKSTMEWNKAKDATRDSYNRLYETTRGGEKM